MREKKYHRAFGVYGVCLKDGKLLVINKKAGPYKNRFDLPGGSLNEGESLIHAIKREFNEETGLIIGVDQNIGATDFKLPWDWNEYTDVHHIAIFYSVHIKGGTLMQPLQFEGQDSDGALWVMEHEVSEENASPLVLKAFEWINTNQIGINVTVYKQWEVK